MTRLYVIAGIAAAALLASTCVAFVDETESAFLTRFGKVDESRGTLEPGLTLKLPWPIDRVRRFDRRLQIYEPPALERVTMDKKSLTVGSYICWRIDDVDQFFRTVGTIADAHRRLEEQVSAQLSAEIGKRELGQLVSTETDKSEVERMMTALTDRIAGTARDEFGIKVVDVRLRRFNHPSDVRQSIYDRIRSERNRDAVRYRSEGDSEAQRIRSGADLARDEILAEAEQKATVIRGKAEAEKTSILNEAHAKNPAFYDLLRTLEAYRKILDDKTTLVLSTDNAIFRLLTETAPIVDEPELMTTPAGAGSPPAAKTKSPDDVDATGVKPSARSADSGDDAGGG